MRHAESPTETLKERILYVAELKGIAKEKMCMSLDMTYGSFRGDAKARPINSDALALFFKLYPDISHDWLIHGEGDIYKNSSDIKPEIKNESMNDKELIEQLNKTISAHEKTISVQEKTIQSHEKTIEYLRAEKDELKREKDSLQLGEQNSLGKQRAV